MITVYEPNKIDYSLGQQVTMGYDSSTTATPDQVSALRNLRNRSNLDGVGGIVPPGQVTDRLAIDVSIGDAPEIDTIVLVNHKFWAYIFSYRDISGIQRSVNGAGLSLRDNSPTTTFIKIPPVILRAVNSFSLILTAPTGFIGATISQLVLTREIGSFRNQLMISKMSLDSDRKKQLMVTKKTRVIMDQRRYMFRLTKNAVVDKRDLALQQFVFESGTPLLWSIQQESPGDFVRTGQLAGYRSADISLMIPTNMYNPDFNESRYNQGAKIEIDLVESV